jgi:hypothetical protein
MNGSTTKINDNAYDRIEWDFFEAMQRKLGFNNGIVNLLMIKKSVMMHDDMWCRIFPPSFVCRGWSVLNVHIYISMHLIQSIRRRKNLD